MGGLEGTTDSTVRVVKEPPESGRSRTPANKGGKDWSLPCKKLETSRRYPSQTFNGAAKRRKHDSLKIVRRRRT